MIFSMEGLLILGKLVGSGLATIGVVGAGIGIGLIFAGVVIAVSRNRGIERETRSRFLRKSFYEFTEVSEIIGGFTKYNEFIRSIFRKTKFSKSNFYKILVVKVLFLIYLVKLGIIRLSIMLNLSMEVSSNKFEGKYGQSNEGSIDHKEGGSLSRDMGSKKVKGQQINKINLIRNRRDSRRVTRRYRYSSSNQIVQLINDMNMGWITVGYVSVMCLTKVIFYTKKKALEGSNNVTANEADEKQKELMEKGIKLIEDQLIIMKDIKVSTDSTINLMGDRLNDTLNTTEVVYLRFI